MYYESKVATYVPMDQCNCDAYMAMEEGTVQSEDRGPHANSKPLLFCLQG